jgi:serine/threonine protein kinase
MNKLNDKYLLIEELVSGEFGKVYKAQHKISKNLVVIKIEKKTNISLLLYEIKIYNALKSYSYISNLRNFFSTDIENILIIDYYGDNLVTLKYKLDSISILLREKINFINILTIDIINAIEELHKLEYIYRDIKPQNICYFNNNIKIIDLGFCKKYINNGLHISNNKINNIIGTINYISKSVLELNTPSRKDDIESIIYLYMFLLLPQNYWKMYTSNKNENKKNLIIIEKIINKLFKNNFNEYSNINLKYISEYINNIRKINFYEEPNYKLYKIFIKSI